MSIVTYGQDANDPPVRIEITNKTTSDNRVRVAVEKSDADGKDFFTHNWADKTTWYEDAARITNEALYDTGDRTVYDCAHQFVIDTYHGKITQEDTLLDSQGNSYRVEVKVNGAVKTEQDPHYGSGGDYTVNYASGIVTFNTAQPVGADVRMTYHYARSSIFTITPEAGKKLTIDIAEVQFSDDIEITDTVVFDTYGLVDVFVPQLVPSVYSSGTIIKIDTFKYKTMNDYQNAALKSYPKYPPMGGSGWRGQTAGIHVFDWDYLKSKKILSSAGMKVVLRLEHDEPFLGAYATATMYCGIENEE
jgi:hypothetical protein